MADANIAGRSAMIYGILLAAGTSSRMGQPKQLLLWRGQSLVRHMAAQALDSQIAGLIVVLGAGAPAVRAALSGLDGRVQLVENPDYPSGQASSVRAGLAALPPAAAGAIILLVDQPLVGSGLIDRLIDAFRDAPDVAAVVPTYQGRRGNPVLLARTLFAALQQLTGDSGARGVLAGQADRVRLIDVDDRAVVTDIDTPEEYAQVAEADG
jgi:molybdenum cofactor cytidylyltransferase